MDRGVHIMTINPGTDRLYGFMLNLRPDLTTNQQVFDAVCQHLAAQKRRAVAADGYCEYQTRDGLRCAIGGILADGHARRAIGFRSVGYEWLNIPEGVTLGLLGQLQLAHDLSETLTDLDHRLTETATLYHLDGSHVATITEWTA